MTKYLLYAALLVLSTVPTFAQPKAPLPEFSLQKANSEAHMRFLAADELQGRKTGEAGNLVAARYLAEQFRKYGLTPAPGQSTYYQKVPLEKLGESGTGEIVAGGQTLPSGQDWILMAGGAAELEAPLVYAGYGLENTAKGWDDYKGLDVKGKIVLVQSGTPETQTPSEMIASSTEKRHLAAQKGALAVIELFNTSIPWNYVTKYFAGERISLAEKTSTGPTLPHAWVNGKEAKWTRLFREVQSIKLTTQGRSIKHVDGYNVAAYISGSDAKLKEQYLLLTAHYDHIGIDKQGDKAAADRDSIFNGARDNAFGCVALLAAAEALAKNPPKRSVLIVAVTGEEVGLLGSRYYANNPLLPLNKCVFNFNSDGAGYNDTGVVGVIGLDRTGARAEIERASKAFGLDVVADPAPEQGLFDRSDNVNFAIKGIPAPTFTPGFRKFDEDIMKDYHQVSDNPETVDFDYLLKFSQAYAHAARLIADRAQAPAWVKGDKYEEAAKQLYK
ncbi:M28 family metallopeptidase [Rhabdobacter roseus]|uniref:Peptidase M28 n=1 Tax=Rhabdobacter roseus TaxID=1655419 RepID=A0A840TQW5_9BACT|nr:M28 family peptidase [Rhabdobacter roseus]MBB5282388.1 hypothetical protein [Rhabdobacter roseus]